MLEVIWIGLSSEEGFESGGREVWSGLVIEGGLKDG